MGAWVLLELKEKEQTECAVGAAVAHSCQLRGSAEEDPHACSQQQQGGGLRAVLIEECFFLDFSVFFQEKQEKQEKQETFPKFGNLTEGKIFGTRRIPIFGKTTGKGHS